MLMTPITPNVMASPIAASSSTEPSERPYQSVLHRRPDRKLALDRGNRVARGALHGSRRARRQAGQQAERVLVAAGADDADRVSLSASEASSEFRITAARASVSACLTRASVSFASAASSAGSTLSSRDLNTACAAWKRRLGSGAISVRPPSAASMARRMRLLISTAARSPGSSATASPVSARKQLAVGILGSRRPSSRR